MSRVTIDPIGRATVRSAASRGPLLVQGDNAGARRPMRRSDGAAVAYACIRRRAPALTPARRRAGRHGRRRAAASPTRAPSSTRSPPTSPTASTPSRPAGATSTARRRSRCSRSATPHRHHRRARPTRAASPPRRPVGGGSRDNSNLAALRRRCAARGRSRRRSPTLSTANAAALSRSAQRDADAQTAIRDGASPRATPLSGVNLDKEAVDLIRFQQAYQASSRVDPGRARDAAVASSTSGEPP